MLSEAKHLLGGMKQYCVYIMSNRSRTLYTGKTNNLARRVQEHKRRSRSSFTQKYNVTQLVYYESLPSFRAARQREGQIKGWLRSKKIALIESMNPNWQDLAADWFDQQVRS